MKSNGTRNKVVRELAGFRLLREAGLIPKPSRWPRLVRTLATKRAAGIPYLLGDLHEEATALVDSKGAMSYAGLGRLCGGFGNGALLGMADGRGARPVVGLMLRNSRYSLVSLLTCMATGSDIILMNADMGAKHVAEVVGREGIRMVIYDQEFEHLFDGLDVDVARIIAWYEGAMPVNSIDAAASRATSTQLPSNRAVGKPMLLTSGTTGAPKGAPPDDAKPSLALAGGFVQKIPLRKSDRVLLAAPMFHGWGLIIASTILMMGGTLLLDRRFDPKRAVDTMVDQKATVLIVVPTMMRRIMQLGGAETDRIDRNTLRIIGTGGAKMDVAMVEQVLESFGPVLHNLYGCTEAGFITIATPADLIAEPACAGSAPLGVTVRILDDSGNEVSSGRTGRIFVDSGMQLSRYSDGAEKKHMHGMMDTGDTGRLDSSGRLFVEGRSDGMIVSGGENVFPEEVELALAAHRDILDAAVVAVPDDDFGQRLRAYIVPKDSAITSVEGVKDYIATELGRSRVPRDVVFLDELPRGSSGKVVRRLLDEIDVEYESTFLRKDSASDCTTEEDQSPRDRVGSESGARQSEVQ